MRKKWKIVLYVFASISIISAALMLSYCIIFLLSAGELKNPSKDYSTLSMMVGMIDGIVGAFSVSIVVYQLRAGTIVERKKNNIEEARTLTGLNDTFNFDEEMQDLENALELNPITDVIPKYVTDEGRKSVVKYLVYLENLATSVELGALTINHIDKLMYYRFFLIMNSATAQAVSLCPYAYYYRSCYELYEKWRCYKKARGQIIPFEENSLDLLQGYEKAIGYDYEFESVGKYPWFLEYRIKNKSIVSDLLWSNIDLNSSLIKRKLLRIKGKIRGAISYLEAPSNFEICSEKKEFTNKNSNIQKGDLLIYEMVDFERKNSRVSDIIIKEVIKCYNDRKIVVVINKEQEEQILDKYRFINEIEIGNMIVKKLNPSVLPDRVAEVINP